MPCTVLNSLHRQFIPFILYNNRVSAVLLSLITFYVLAIALGIRRKPDRKVSHSYSRGLSHPLGVLKEPTELCRCDFVRFLATQRCMWDPSSPTRDQNCTPPPRPAPALRAQSQPLDRHGSPYHHCFEDEEMKLSTTVDSCKLAAELEFKTRCIINNLLRLL